MRENDFYSVLLILLIIISLSSCTSHPNNINKKLSESRQTINAIEDYEKEIINLMNQVDLIPYYQKQILKKKKKEAELKKQEKESTSSETKKSDSGQKPEEGEGQQEAGSKTEGGQEFQVEPITNKDVLLLELLKQEDPYKLKKEENKKIPDDIVFIWHGINEKINQLHLKWNDLEVRLNQGEVNKEIINGFDNTLNTVTIFSNQNKYLETLITANELTSYIPQFINDLNNSQLASIFSMKYYTRKTILDIAANNYATSMENIENLQYEKENLSARLGKEEYKVFLDKLELSIANLEKAISLKDMDVIKIKGSIIIKNINSIKNEI